MGKTVQDLLNLVKDSNNEKYFIRLSDFLVGNYTFIDDDNLINFCFKSGECKRTQLFVDEEFLIDRLNYDSIKLYFIGNLYSWVFDSVFNEYDMKDVELASIFITLYFFPKLYEKYYKPLEPDYINESIDRKTKYKLSKKDTNNLISLYEDMGYDEKSAIDELTDLVSHFNSLDSRLILYRIVCADSEDDINREYLGNHYSLNKGSLVKNYHQRGSLYDQCIGDNVFLITVECYKSQMDVIETLSNNILYPNEEEITLKNKGFGCRIIKVEEL